MVKSEFNREQPVKAVAVDGTVFKIEYGAVYALPVETAQILIDKGMAVKHIDFDLAKYV